MIHTRVPTIDMVDTSERMVETISGSIRGDRLALQITFTLKYKYSRYNGVGLSLLAESSKQIVRSKLPLATSVCRSPDKASCNRNFSQRSVVVNSINFGASNCAGVGATDEAAIARYPSVLKGRIKEVVSGDTSVPLAYVHNETVHESKDWPESIGKDWPRDHRRPWSAPLWIAS